MKDKKRPKRIFRKPRIPFKFIKVAALFCIFVITLIACHCSKTVDIIVPYDEEPGVSAYGSCVVCHTNAQMVAFTASPMPAPPGEGSEG